MKTQIKRLLALILAMAMSLSLLSANVWAAELETAEEASVSAQSSEEVITKDEPAEEEVSTEESAPAEEEISAAEEAPAAEYTEEKPAQGDTSEQSAAEEENTSSETESEANLTPQETKSGKCGKNLTWTLDDSGTLTISGTGEMYDFNSGCPWEQYQNDIHAVIIGDGVTSISGGSFSNYSALSKVTIGKSVTSIGRSAFASCSNLTSITIPNSVTSIGVWAFEGCSALSNVNIGSGVTSIGSNAFEDTPWLTGLGDFAIVNGLLFVYQGDKYNDAEVVIPNSVTSIGERVFESCYMTSVVIPDSVTSIGSSAFRACPGLTSVTIGNGVTSIGEYAFCNCSSLTSITIPNSVTSIGYRAFADCSSLTSITILNSVTSIGGYAFSGCHDLSNVTLGNSVTSIGYRAFADCSNLTSITIPNSVTSIGANAFYDCNQLTFFVYFGSRAHSYAKIFNKQYQVLNKQSNTISSEDMVWSYSTIPQHIRLSAYANGVKLSYQTDNPKVVVDKNGKVTLPAKFSGTVKITITAAATNEYNAATKTITVTVPTAATVTKATAGKGQMTVQWKKNTTGKGYEVQYSTDKKFKKSAKTVKIKENSTVKTTIKKLNPGTWYVRIRTINGTAYSDWSKAKEVVVCPSTSTLSSVKWDKKKKVVNVSWKKNTTGKGYEIQYSTDKSFKKGAKTVKIKKNTTVNTTIKKLKVGTWYIRIRTINGKTYSDWSKAKTVKVK